MDEYFTGKVLELQNTADVSYLLENNELFYDIGYKVMQNQENTNLLTCHRLKYNGKIKLVYFTSEYISLPKYMEQADVEGLLNVIRNLIEALVRVESLGFLNMAYVENRISHIFVEPNTQTIKIIYLPVNIGGVQKSRNIFENEIKVQLIKAIENYQVMNHPKMKNVLTVLGDGTLKLQDVGIQVQATIGVPMPQEREPQPQSHGAPMGMQNSMMAQDNRTFGSYIILEAVDRSVAFQIDTDEFVIGKSAERVNGVIMGNNAISRVHCKVIRQNGNYYLVDIGSSNGTFVNGNRVSDMAPVPIYEGCKIKIANMDFVVRR